MLIINDDNSTMPADLSLDLEVIDSMETPQLETPRTCTRQTPCCKQTCLKCSLPTDGNHIQNLTVPLHPTASTATIANKPAPPIAHWISKLSSEIQDAILQDDFIDLKLLTDLYAQKFLSKPDALKFDHSDLCTAWNNALKIINSSSPVPNFNSPSSPPTPSA